MRFKKLRLFVGIAILIFVLVVGNIIAFGLMHNQAQSQSNIAAIDTRKSSANTAAAEATTSNSATNSNSAGTANNNNPATTDTSTTANTNQQTQTNNIVYQPIRTRAS